MKFCPCNISNTKSSTFQSILHNCGNGKSMRHGNSFSKLHPNNTISVTYTYNKCTYRHAEHYQLISCFLVTCQISPVIYCLTDMIFN